MTILTALRDRFSTREASAVESGDPDQGPAAASRAPFAGYEGLNSRQVIAGMSRRSQSELEAVEAYERSHQDRKPVLDKLHYMRGPEPLTGYDALSPQEIVTSLGKADVKTLKKVRAYERKFADRPDLLEEVARARDRRLVVEPPSVAPAYRAMTVTSGASRLTSGTRGRGDRADGRGRR